ncbi:Isoleucyl-tRNA synthetase [Candidatus Koribacter versatilis Ellin345]|uniref:Isoleucine--tRNA ligase n=1 Tax=Koribacter versatilis (strain Ellin345) TaxID=204669 RepID=Q1IQI8_KORVE|nr:isoleucine--tRNA ligase [Candidatus Koribacter versatilis]ABF40862.1 Isoleucyl-tRNA synthetase [Candidatus Koribacter versatilis Ellin345]
MPLELKDTINLPKTDFAMKANLPLNEPKMLARWEEQRIYELIRESRQGKPSYILHDGPPYANGPIHLGHALNKCLKDFVVKSKTMAGFDAPYIPGWDCHGLPIEIKVDEQLGRKKLEMDPLDVRAACAKYALKYLDTQREQFKRLGVFGQWDKPYSTMTPEYESVVLRIFYDFLEQGAVYKGLRPVYWCIHDKTALAEAEVEYEMHTSPSVYVRYMMTSDPGGIDPALAGKQAAAIIWTTTPWTLPASMAIAFSPNAEYVGLEHDGLVYIVAGELAEATKAKTDLHDAKEIARFAGSKLERATFQHPFLDRSILGVLADYVTMDTGTGAVHTAPAHGADDFYTGVKYGIDQTCNVDEAGRLRNGLPEYDGMTVFKANPVIVQLLRERGVLLGFENIEHSYPHCWRCHNPIIFRATEQWFIAMEAKMSNGTLRSVALDEIKKVKWDPSWGEERISNMIATRPDWCISRQRLWGVPIAVFFCEGCNTLVSDKAVNAGVVERVVKEGGDTWYKHQASELLPSGYKCSKCGGTSFRKEMDIIDVWFESGSSKLAVIGEPTADFYTEGGDQHRGWFHSSLLCHIGAQGHAPYKHVATSGWTLDPQGRAMSKSLGNVVDPVDIAKRLGAEIVRLWVASVDFREDVRASEELMQRVAENYKKIRNTFRYILGNLKNFDPAKDALKFEELQPFDQYILLRLAEVIGDVRDWYDEMSFHKLFMRLKDFCVVDLSAVYFDVIKDRLYISLPDAKARRSAQTAIWTIGEALVRLLAPLMSFTAEELWQFFPAVEGRPTTVHAAYFPKAEDVADNRSGEAAKTIESEYERLIAVRTDVLKALEEARNAKLIGSGLEAQVVLTAPAELVPLLEKHKAELRYLFIVSDVQLATGGTNGSGLQVQVNKAPGQKCERCWNYSTHVGEDAEYPTVCERCSPVLHKLEATAGAH